MHGKYFFLIRKISEISSDASLQGLLRRLDENNDQQISSDEVDFDRDGFLDPTSTSFSYSIEQRNAVQNILFQRGFIRFRSIERLELEGNPNFGTVIFLRQTHDRPELNDRIRVAVGRFQVAMLFYLMERNAQHVFDEGSTQDMLAYIPTTPWPEHQGLERARNLLVQRLLSGNIANSSLSLHASDGAAGVYGLLFNDVSFHRSVEPWEEDYYRRITHNPSLPKHLRDYYRMQVRERAAARQIITFFREQPGEVVYLIYGARHEFADDFSDPFFNPRLISVTFPDHSAQVDDIYNQEIDRSVAWMNRVTWSFLGLSAGLFLWDRIRRALSPRNPPDDPGSPPEGPSAAAPPASETPNENLQRSRIGVEETLGVSALLGVGAATLYYAPQVLNVIRNAAPVALQATLLGLMMLGG